MAPRTNYLARSDLALTRIKRVYKIDPMIYPKCGQDLAIVSFIEPPQADVIEKILRHCGLWQDRTSRAPPDVEVPV